MSLIKELQKKQVEAHNASQALLKTAKDDGRQLTADEQGKFNELCDVYDDCKEKITEIQNQQARESRVRTQEAELQSSAGRLASSENPSDAGGADENRILHHGEPLTFSAGHLLSRCASPDYRVAFGQWLAGNPQAALQTSPDTAGGFAVPTQTASGLIQALDDSLFFRQIATVLAPLTSGDSLGVVSLDADPADADWTTEVAAVSADNAMAFGGRELNPHPLSKLVLASNRFLRAAAISPEQFIRERLTYKFRVTEEKAFMTGSGANQPLGVFTASNSGIGTARDISTGNTTTAITGNGLIAAKYNLKEGYQRRASWIFHRDAIRNIRQIVDSNGQYVWRAGLATDKPDTILDSPYFMSEYAPNTFTTKLYVGVYGDFSNYWIADSLAMSIQKLVELYAATNQTGFIGRKETDGMPMLAEAFTRVKLA